MDDYVCFQLLILYLRTYFKLTYKLKKYILFKIHSIIHLVCSI